MLFGNNFGVKCFDIINFVKVDMEKMCLIIVLCVDIIVMVGCDVVVFNGGFDIKIFLGRKDVVFLSVIEVDVKFFLVIFSIDRVFNVFGVFGMIYEESVVILGMNVDLSFVILMFFIKLFYFSQCF